MEKIFAEKFFNINHPGAPWISIQLRTKIILENNDLENSEHWESITSNPSNTFISMNFEDTGGVYNLNLELFDKNFADLENKLIKSIAAVRSANKLIKDPAPTNNKNDDPKTPNGEKYFEFFVSTSVSSNLRIRFGYSEWADDSEYYDPITLKDNDWINRIDNDKPVIRTPWLYFQISNVNFNLKEDGLHANLTAFSSFGDFLSRAKMIQHYAILKGEPKNIIDLIIKYLNLAAKNASNNEDTVEVEYEHDPIIYPSEDPEIPEGEENFIRIMMGTEAAVPKVIGEDANGEKIYHTDVIYKNVKSLLNEVCSKISPRIYNRNGDIIDEKNASIKEMDENSAKMYQSVKYDYLIKQIGTKSIIKFYYQDPNEQKEKQKNVRVYPWFNDGRSLITNFDIKTETDFANLNLPIININEEGIPSLKIANGENTQKDEDGNPEELEAEIGKMVSVHKDIESQKEQIEKYNEMFDKISATFILSQNDTSEYMNGNDLLESEKAALIYSRNLITNLNKTVYKGKIIIPGDPFYLFDDYIKPYSYIINLIIKRPDYVGFDGEFKEGGISYLSGDYIIGKINHTFSTGGYFTELEVMKWTFKK